MHFSKSSILALALAAPALACVDFRADYHPDTGRINAALTDNGQQKCTLTDAFYGRLPWEVTNSISMTCVDDYHAEVNLLTRLVHVWHGSFDGTFAVNFQLEGATLWSYSARVWGC